MNYEYANVHSTFDILQMWWLVRRAYRGAAAPRPDLEVLKQAPAGDLAAVDLLHVDVARTEEPRDQNLQVVDELAVDF